MLRNLFKRSSRDVNSSAEIGKSQPRVKLIAIAKDEAAYFPEWIHHHQFFGFDAFDIYINRTHDNSLAMLNALQQLVPTLNVFSADWADWCPSNVGDYLQFMVYANAFSREREAKHYDYVMFLDIDEYWTPTDMKTSIQDCINAHKNADTISFGWLNQHGEEPAFAELSESVSGQLSPLVKTAVKTTAAMQEVSLHIPLLSDGKQIMVGGDSFVSAIENRECLHDDLVRLRDVMVIHRMFRSSMEYQALLGRGRPSDNLPIKLNRGGYNKALGKHCTLSLATDGFAPYRQSRDEFLAHNKIHHELVCARESVEGRAKGVIDAIRKMPLATLLAVLSAFKGCEQQTVNNVKNAIGTAIDSADGISPESMMKIAAEFQAVDLELAQRVMRKAAKL